MFNTLHTAPLAGTWLGYESTQWLNPPTAPPRVILPVPEVVVVSFILSDNINAIAILYLSVYFLFCN